MGNRPSTSSSNRPSSRMYPGAAAAAAATGTVTASPVPSVSTAVVGSTPSPPDATSAAGRKTPPAQSELINSFIMFESASVAADAQEDAEAAAAAAAAAAASSSHPRRRKKGSSATSSSGDKKMSPATVSAVSSNDHGSKTGDSRQRAGSSSADQSKASAGHLKKAAAPADGPVFYVLGSNDHEQLGREVGTPAVDQWTAVPELREYDLARVQCGDQHSVALGSDGQMVAFGQNADGQLGRSPSMAAGDATLPRALRGTRIVSVSCGAGFTVALAAGGQVLAAGRNSHGQLGKGDRKSCHEFKLVPFFKKEKLHVVAVAAGARHALALAANGDSFGWGDNHRGQVGCGAPAKHLTSPQRIEALWGLPLVQLVAGDSHSLALTVAGNVYAWGDNCSGQLGLGPPSAPATGANQSAPRPVVPDCVSEPCWVHAFRGAGVVRLATGNAHGLALAADGAVYMWGNSILRNQLQGLLDQLGGGAKVVSSSASDPAGAIATGMSSGEAGSGTAAQSSSLGDGSSSNPSDASTSVTATIEPPVKLGLKAPFDRCTLIASAYHCAVLSLSSTNHRGSDNQDDATPAAALVYVVGGRSGTFVVPDLAKSAPAIVDQLSVGANHCVAKVIAASANAGAGSQPSTSSSVLLPALSGAIGAVRHCASPLPFVTERQLRRAADAARSDPKALSALCAWIEGVFSCASSLNQSFLAVDARLPSVPAADADAEFRRRIGLDLASVRRAYVQLWSLGEPAIEQAMLSGLQRLAAAVLSRRRNVVQPELLRMFMIALESPALLNADAFKAPVLASVLRAVLSLPDPLKDLLFNTVGRYPAEYFLMPLNILERYVAHLLASQARPSAGFTAACVLLEQLARRNDELRLVPQSAFYNSTAVALLERSPESEYWLWRQQGDSLCKYPFLLSANAKALVLRTDAHAQMKQQIENSLFASVMSGQMNVPYLVLAVRRPTVVDDALHQLTGRAQADLKKPLKVKFMGEEGIDAGGVTKEFFQLVVGQLFDVRYGMFVFDKDTRACWFNEASIDQGSEFQLVGLVLGLAIYNSVILDLQFPGVVYKKLLGQRPTLADLAEASPMTARSLQQLLAMPADQFEDAFGDDLDFTVTRTYYDQQRTVELCPGGNDRCVTAANRDEYVQLYVDYVLVKSVERQFDAFKDGFLSVAGGPVLSLFSPEELELLAVGNREFDIAELEQVAAYAGGFSPSHRTVRDFWAVVHSWPKERQRKLLSFCTGSDRIPINGLKSLKFIVHNMGSRNELLPASATCFNTLYLPTYSTRALLKQKLEYAVDFGSQGFGLQ